MHSWLVLDIICLFILIQNKILVVHTVHDCQKVIES
jgi:hypothetical protein